MELAIKIESLFLAYPIFGGLLTLMLMDVTLGILLSIIEKRLSSDISRRGMTRKIVMLLLVLASEILGRMTGKSGVGELSSLFFIVSELISVLENAAQLGAPIPPPLLAVLAQLRTMTGSDVQFRMGDSPAEHERILQERKDATGNALSDPADAALDVIDGGGKP